jgi:hypothetical protein
MFISYVDELTKSRVFGKKDDHGRPPGFDSKRALRYCIIYKLIYLQLTLFFDPGLAFDSLQCVFRSSDIDIFFSQDPPEPTLNADVHIMIDPAGTAICSEFFLLFPLLTPP